MICFIPNFIRIGLHQLRVSPTKIGRKSILRARVLSNLQPSWILSWCWVYAREFYCGCVRLVWTGNSKDIITNSHSLRILAGGKSHIGDFPPLHHRGQESHWRHPWVAHWPVSFQYDEWWARGSTGNATMEMLMVFFRLWIFPMASLTAGGKQLLSQLSV